MSKYLLLLLSAICLTAGCDSNPKPRLRLGAYFGPASINTYPEYTKLGRHCRRSGIPETNGLVYTSKAGFIDIGHVREAADRTAYLAEEIRLNLVNGENSFGFEVIEPSEYLINIEYPEDWNRLSGPEREMIIKEVSIRLGQYLAHKSMIWHEMITWFGFTSTGIFSEHISSFSCEDGYSDVMGTHLGLIALSHPIEKFDETMTQLLEEELERLGVQEPKVAKEAMKLIKGKWYKGGHYFFTKVNKRNFDIGFDDESITPWLVPGICPGAEPEPYPVPNLDFMTNYGFSMQCEMVPKVHERKEIMSILSGKNSLSYIDPESDFPVIMDFIREDAREEYGPLVEVPSL